MSNRFIDEEIEIYLVLVAFLISNSSVFVELNKRDYNIFFFEIIWLYIDDFDQYKNIVYEEIHLNLNLFEMNHPLNYLHQHHRYWMIMILYVEQKVKLRKQTIHSIQKMKIGKLY